MPYMSVLPGRDSSFSLRVGPHAIPVDRSPEFGGHGTGPSPVELFVGSVAACAADAAREFLVGAGRPLDLLELGCHYEIAGGRITSIQLTLRLASELDPDRQAGLLKAVHRCGLSVTLLVPLQLTVATAAAVA